MELDPRGAGRARRVRVLLLGSVFVVAACGLVYELVAGALGSYLLGDAVTQFSLVIGVFLSAMGVGSWLSRFVRRDLLHWFVGLEIVLGLLGGASSVVLFATSAMLPELLQPVFYGQCGILGVLVGLEIPLLVRILRDQRGWEEALSDTLALDYLGALAGALAFPLLALPWLGLSRASLVFGFLNLAVAGLGVALVPRGRRNLLVGLTAAALALTALLVGSQRLVGYLEDLHYDDSVVYARSSPYARVVLTRWRSDIRLYLDGHLQFSSVDEARYHEALVIPAMEATTRPPQRVLVLGGGDGLAIKRVLAYDSVREVTLVDLDPTVVELARTRPSLRALHGDAFSDPRVTVIHDDAFTWIQEQPDRWDVILVDLPDPNSPSLARLYSTAFYAQLDRHLADGGALVTQATSPYYAKQAFWCIERTLAAALPADGPRGALQTAPYHVNVPSFGQWGFVLATHHRVDPASLAPSIPTSVLTPELLPTLFVFPQDVERPDDVRVNHLDDPILHQYHLQGWRSFNG